MRLTNADDQSVIKKLLPDSIGNFADLLPVLDIGEAIAVGDASLLPSRILIDEPETKPIALPLIWMSGVEILYRMRLVLRYKP